MSLHIHYRDKKCSKCSILYIPFKKNFHCPNCNRSTEDFFDFIPEVINSMNYHKSMYGRFLPCVWYVGSLADHIQKIIFLLFDALEEKKPSNPKKFIISSLRNIKWGDQQYLEDHIKDITLAVYDIYKDDEKLQRKIDLELEAKKNKKNLKF